MKKEPKYATEAALCADFIAWVKRDAGRFHHGVKTPVWTPYAETAGWDILLVAADGTQIGVQAKLKFNMKVLAQSLPDWNAWHDRGPDFRAVLVPERSSEHGNICDALGLTLMHPYADFGSGMDFEPSLNMQAWNAGWHYWSPREREVLPEFVPDVIAGDSGPVQLTKWKIAALRVVAELEVRGHVTRQDFRNHQIDPRRWMHGWLKPGAVPGQFVRGELDFDRQHPLVYAEVLAEIRAKQERQEALS